MFDEIKKGGKRIRTFVCMYMHTPGGVAVKSLNRCSFQNICDSKAMM